MDVKELLDFMMQGIAPGITEDAWDFTPNSADPDFYEEWYALAQSFKWAVLDRIETLRKERNPATAVEKLPDYELALGLQFTNTAQFGTVAQRQNQIVGRFRESGGLAITNIQNALEPYLLYQDPTQIQVIEPDRAAQQAAHTYDFPTPFAPSSATTVSTTVTDDSWVSDGGARVFINMEITGGSGAAGIVQLRGPDGFMHQWAVADYLGLGTVVGPSVVFDLVLYAQDFAPQLNAARTGYDRHTIRGTWQLTVKNMTTVNSASVFVEGVGRDSLGNDGLGAAMFQWGVFVDSTKLGSGYDLIGAQAATQRINHAHLIGSLILDGDPMSFGAAIPDDPNAIPDMSIPG